VDRTAIVLAGECCRGFGQDTSLLELKGLPLVQHVVTAVSEVADEIILVTESQEHANQLEQVLGPHVKYVSDVNSAKGGLAEAVRGFEAATQKYALLIAGCAPFVSGEIVDLLFDLCPGRSAVIPRWPNAETDPLHAVYRVDVALEAAKVAIAEGRLSLDGLIEQLRGVRYVSTLVVQELDPDLKTLFRVNSPVDLKRAEVMTKPKPTKSKK
jgi:molybdopterin-guanine dinucleotide biosynthesis protein A